MPDLEALLLYSVKKVIDFLASGGLTTDRVPVATLFQGSPDVLS